MQIWWIKNTSENKCDYLLIFFSKALFYYEQRKTKLITFKLLWLLNQLPWKYATGVSMFVQVSVITFAERLQYTRAILSP